MSKERFIVHKDGTVTDVVTGLMWVQDDKGEGCNNGIPMKWADAMEWVKRLKFAGYDDWRLPDVLELISIVNYSCAYPALNPIFTLAKSDYYWSSTTFADNPSEAWGVYFYSGLVLTTAKTHTNYVRPVRGSQSV